MTNVSNIAGIIILGLVVILAGFIPTYLAFYKKNNNAWSVLKFNAVSALGFGVLGMALSLIFQATGTSDQVWALIILIIIELVRLAAWIYLLIMSIKDKDLFIF